jgi:hypothetical protein
MGDYKVSADTAASRGRHQFVTSTPIGRVDHCPNDSVPASLGPRRKDGQQRVSFRQQSHLCTEVPDTGMMSFADFVDGQPEYIRTLLQHADLSDATAKAVANQAYNTNNPLHCGSDGGLLLDHGTFGYVWAITRPRTFSRRAMDRFLATPTGCLPHDLNCVASSQLLRTSD